MSHNENEGDNEMGENKTRAKFLLYLHYYWFDCVHIICCLLRLFQVFILWTWSSLPLPQLDVVSRGLVHIHVYYTVCDYWNKNLSYIKKKRDAKCKINLHGFAICHFAEKIFTYIQISQWYFCPVCYKL